jgi:hypothetical protein
MSTESLISNLEYNTKMDKNINLSVNSTDGTILPEDLSYVITINTPNKELHTPNEEVHIPNRFSNNNYLVLKLNTLILIASIIILCIIFI